MSDKTRLNCLCNFFSEGMLGLCLAAMLVTTASAHQISGSDLNPTSHAESPYIDPNGLELDGAGSVQNPVSLETLDLALLGVWASITLGLVGIAVSVGQHRKRASQASRDPISVAARQEP
jgi:hypothetical protein